MNLVLQCPWSHNFPTEPEERLGDGGRLWSRRLPWQLLHNLRTKNSYDNDEDDSDGDNDDEGALGDAV